MITFENAITKLAERLSDKREAKRNVSLQRRNQVVDIYGMEFTRQGDAGRPATFYLSISPDLIYFERFEFKIIIESFKVPIASDGIRPEIVRVRDTELTIQDAPSFNTGSTQLTIAGEGLTTSANEVSPNPHTHLITPNPHQHMVPPHRHDLNPSSHSHETDAHSHTIVAGMSYFSSTATEFEVWIEGIDLTPYFKAQFPNQWVDGEGVFPEAGTMNYDVLEAVGYMEEDLRQRILTPGYKKIEIKGNGIFNATLVNYLKYPHVNR